MKNKYDEKKAKIKERLKLKLEYSEKIKNNENNKILKKFSNIKNNELPKLKISNYLNNNSEDIDSFNNLNSNNNNDNFIIYNKIKKGYNIHPKNKKKSITKKYTINDSPKNLHNMNLISFNENINNIYKKVTINDFNKEMNNKEFYNMLQNLDNILEINSPDKNSENLSLKMIKKISPNNSEISKNSRNDKILLNILNQNNENNNNIEEPINQIKCQKNDGKRFNFLRDNTTFIDIKNQKKNYTNKSSLKKFDNEQNLNILDTEQNIQNKSNNLKAKKKLFEEDFNYINKDNVKKSFDLGENKKDFIQKVYKENNSEEEENSDVTIMSLCSEDIKDISSDF